MNLFAILMPLYQILVKIATTKKQVNPLDVIVMRTFACMVGGAIITKVGNDFSFYVKPNQRWDIFIRSLIGTIGHMSMTYGIKFVPLVIVNILYNTAPFWTCILAWCLIGEKLSSLQILALVVSFFGICLVSLSSSMAEEEDEASTFSQESTWLIGCICILITAWTYAGVSVYTRRMQNVPFSVLLFYLGVLSFTVALLIIIGESLLFWQPLRLLNYDQSQYIPLISQCIVNFMVLVT